MSETQRKMIGTRSVILEEVMSIAKAMLLQNDAVSDLLVNYSW